MSDAEGQQAFGSRTDGNPAISVGGGKRQAGLDLHEPSAKAGPALPKFTVGDSKVDGRQPLVQKRRSERQHVIAVGDVELRKPFFPETGPHGSQHQGGVGGIVVHERTAELIEEDREEAMHGPGQRATDHRRRLGTLSKLADPQGQSFFPGNLRKTAFAARAHPFQRTPYPVRMVQRLYGSLSARADFALVEGMSGIAFDLFRASFHGADENPAAGGAFSADGGVPIRHAGHDFIVRQEIRHEAVDLPLAARQCRAGCSHPEHLQ